jgi:type IV pilus assembly protein PilM
MGTPKAVWGIDIGQCALKALKVRQVEGQLQVEALDIIEHPQILSQADANRSELIRSALDQFLSRNSVAGCAVVVSAPGNSFSKFVKLPPIEARRIPDIVRFEAEQQIPFPINDVVWRWKTFRDPDSPDIEVGIFAMKKSDVSEMLSHFAAADLNVDVAQIVPLALYNFLHHDEQLAPGGATILVDVGADKTDLVVADSGRIWTRTIQIGGNNFTEALLRTFKLSFDKAEQHKRTAASSKYARQIFQAMRPVFADLVQEIQRSVGYYTQLHRETRFVKLLGLGNGFRLPGLQKFMEQNLNIPVARVDTYNRLRPSEAVNAPTLNENVLSFAVAYGLAVQGLGLADVDTNLLPREILRKRVWNAKRPWFVAAAAAIIAALAAPAYRNYIDLNVLAEGEAIARVTSKPDELNARLEQLYRQADLTDQDEQLIRSRALPLATTIRGDLQGLISKYDSLKGAGDQEERLIADNVRLYDYRDFWLAFNRLLHGTVDAVAVDQKRLEGYARFLAVPADVRERLLAGSGAGATAGDTQMARMVMGEAEQMVLRRQLAQPGPALRAMSQRLLKNIGEPNEPQAVAGLTDEQAKAMAERLLVARKLREMQVFDKSPRNNRQVLILEDVKATYLSPMPDRPATEPLQADNPRPIAGPRRGFQIEIGGWTPLPQSETARLLRDLWRFTVEYSKWMDSMYLTVFDQQLSMQVVKGVPAPKAGEEQERFRPQDNDTTFKLTWMIEVVNDGVTMASVQPGSAYTLTKNLLLLPTFQPPSGMSLFQADEKNKPRVLPAGAVITVREQRTQLTAAWYKVSASGADGKAIGEGWISGEALDNQQVNPVEKAPAGKAPAAAGKRN